MKGAEQRKRAKEQAKEQKCSLEEIASQRWGSLDNFYKLLDEAEGKAVKIHSTADSRYMSSKEKNRRPNDFRERNLGHGHYNKDNPESAWFGAIFSSA